MLKEHITGIAWVIILRITTCGNFFLIREITVGKRHAQIWNVLKRFEAWKPTQIQLLVDWDLHLIALKPEQPGLSNSIHLEVVHLCKFVFFPHRYCASWTIFFSYAAIFYFVWSSLKNCSCAQIGVLKKLILMSHSSWMLRENVDDNYLIRLHSAAGHF